MTIDRRTFVAGLGMAIPLGLTSSCAMANEGDWPGPDTPTNELPKLPIGMNLAGIADWEPGFPFRNLMWGARTWMTRNQLGDGPFNTEQAPFFEYDEDGYPLEVPLKTPGSKGTPQTIFTIVPNVRTPGRYLLYYDGEGSIEGMAGTKVLSKSPGRLLLHMTHSGSDLGEYIVIQSSKRGNHVRNIRILAEGDDPATLKDQPFLPEMQDFCRPFHALRFMDWGAINGSFEDDWSSRRRPTFYTMVPTTGDADGFWGPKPSDYQRMFSGGVAHEIMIQLANMLQKDAWICIPHRATDDYIRKCSALYREKLDPGRRIYVEYSNEVWNWGFNQSVWMMHSEAAGAAVEARGVRAWEMKDGKRQGTNHPERMGALNSRAHRLWLEGWSRPERNRVTTVCGLQAGWADASLRTIDWVNRDGFTDAMSCTGYFGPSKEIYEEWDKKGASLTADDVIRSMWQVVQAQSGKTGAYEIAARAKAFGKLFVNYEGGQHIQPEGQQEKPYLPALKAAQTHPEMYRLYVENLRQQKRLGSSMFCAFTSVTRQGVRWGSWGAKERYTDPNSASPKYRALVDCNS